MTTIQVGNISESIVLATYIRAGYHVSVPFGNGCVYDLVVDAGPRLLKIQVKTGWHCNGCLLYKDRRRIKDTKQNAMRHYRTAGIDFFVGYDPQTDCLYVVPPADRGCLRLEPVLNGQQKFVRWAHDHTWDKHIAWLKEEAESQRSFAQ